MRVSDLITGFSDELSKIASLSRDVDRDEAKREAQGRTRAALAGFVAPSLAGQGMAAAAMPLLNNKREPDRSGLQTQLKGMQLAQDMGVPDVHFMHSGPAASGNAYSPTTKQVFHSTGATEATMAHELGHAKNYNSKFRKPLLAGRLAGHFAGGPSAAITGAMAAGQEDPSWTPGLANLAIHAPTLIDEAAASGHALKHLTKSHGLAKGLRRAVPLLPAFGSYAGVAAAPLGITAYRKSKAKKNESPMQKVALIGAALGGAAGYALGGGSTKTKLINTAVGAGAGHLAGKALGGLKRGVWDEQVQRAHRDLHGYQPSTVTEDRNNFL